MAKSREFIAKFEAPLPAAASLNFEEILTLITEKKAILKFIKHETQRNTLSQSDSDDEYDVIMPRSNPAIHLNAVSYIGIYFTSLMKNLL